MTDPQKDVPYADLPLRRSCRSCSTALPILGILLVLPTSAITDLGGFIDAIKQVFTVYGGHVTSTASPSAAPARCSATSPQSCSCSPLLSSGVTWIMGSDRALAVSGYDGAAPRFLGVISSRFGTPVRVNVLSGAGLHGRADPAPTSSPAAARRSSSARVLGLAVSTTLISYLGIFPALRGAAPQVPHVDRALPGTRPASAITIVPDRC